MGNLNLLKFDHRLVQSKKLSDRNNGDDLNDVEDEGDDDSYEENAKEVNISRLSLQLFEESFYMKSPDSKDSSKYEVGSEDHVVGNILRSDSFHQEGNVNITIIINDSFFTLYIK